jgi:UDP:flavonoid glycosyltransferase YjiC (YdhE family)
MRILMIAFGSRGDVQPLLALGKGLQQEGHTVTLAAGTNNQRWIEGEGLRFTPFHVDVEAYMQTDIGKEWLGNSSSNPMVELQNMKRMTDGLAPQVAADVIAMAQDADLYISGLLTVEPMAALAKAYGKKHIVGTLSPYTPTRSGSAGMQALLPRSDSPLNYVWGYFILSMLHNVMKGPSQYVHNALHLPPVTRSDFLNAWNRTPTLIGVSPSVVPPPTDWGSHIRTTGYWFHPAPADWQPSPALQTFLDAGEPPIYMGFGSMSNRHPQRATEMMITALQQTGKRGIIHSGWAGLHAEDQPQNIFLMDYAPHDWLFPRMAAVVHHGGSGTTHTALRAGVPSMVVAHIGDQPFWGRRVMELGVGAAPIRRHDLSAERLVAGIRIMTSDRTMQQQAAALGERIRAENGVSNAVRAVNELIS